MSVASATSFKKNLIENAKRILAADRILVVSHVHPDGDTIGSLLALGLGLLTVGKRVVMVSPDGIPNRFQFLPGSELVQDHLRGKADVGVAVDCGSIGQLGRFGRVFQGCAQTIQVDHHDFADGFCKHLLVDTEAAAVGEIIYDLLKACGVKITPSIATCLLTSIIVDTGSFRFSNIRSRTFRIAADLLDHGVDLKYLIEEAYWKKTEATVRLESLCFDRMQFEMKGKVVWSVIRQSDLKKLNGMIADVDRVADDLRSIEGVRIAALFREAGNGFCRVSLRSASGINIAKVASHFGGGGHFNAAGCQIKDNPSETRKLIRILSAIVM